MFLWFYYHEIWELGLNNALTYNRMFSINSVYLPVCCNVSVIIHPYLLYTNVAFHCTSPNMILDILTFGLDRMHVCSGAGFMKIFLRYNDVINY